MTDIRENQVVVHGRDQPRPSLADLAAHICLDIEPARVGAPERDSIALPNLLAAHSLNSVWRGACGAHDTPDVVYNIASVETNREVTDEAAA